MEELLSRGLRPPAWQRYGLAVLSSLIALLVRAAFEPWLNSAVPYQFFFLAVIATSAFGGTGPGLLASGLGGLFALAFLIPPFGSVEIPSLPHLIGLLLYFTVASSISFLGGLLYQSRIKETSSRMYYEHTLLGIGDAVLSTDARGRVLIMNRVAEEMTGVSQALARGVYINDVVRFVKEGTEDPVKSPATVVLETGGISGLKNHTDLVRKDGSRVPIEDSAAPVRDAKGNLIGTVLVFRDVSNRRRAELKLEAAEQECRALLESIADCFVSVDTNQKITYINAVAEKRFNVSEETAVGVEMGTAIPQFDTPEIREAVERAAREGRTKVIEGFAARNGFWYDIVFYPHEQGASLYIRDITDRKRREDELKQVNEDLRHFSAAASHDLREPLRTMMLFVELLEMKHRSSLDAEDQAQVREVLAAGRRIDHLVRRLLEYTKIRDSRGMDAVPVDANQALGEAIKDLAASIEEARADINFSPLPNVMIEPTHLYQIFQNLVGNSLKYRSADSPCRITIDAVSTGNIAIISVEDNGIGIPPEFAERVFAPFSRLHGPEVSGAGIGLATCRRILELFGGRIWVEPQPSGTKICFSLRCAETFGRGASA